jgi:hypothetical protein
VAFTFAKLAPAVKSYALYNWGAVPASWVVLRDGVCVARILGVRQSYGAREGYRVRFVCGKSERVDRLAFAKSAFERGLYDRYL